MASDVTPLSKVEPQELQTWDPVYHTGIYKEVCLTVAKASGEVNGMTFICICNFQ